MSNQDFDDSVAVRKRSSRLNRVEDEEDAEEGKEEEEEEGEEPKGSSPCLLEFKDILLAPASLEGQEPLAASLSPSSCIPSADSSFTPVSLTPTKPSRMENDERKEWRGVPE